MSESPGPRRPSAWVERLRGGARLSTTQVAQAETEPAAEPEAPAEATPAEVEPAEVPPAAVEPAESDDDWRERLVPQGDADAAQPRAPEPPAGLGDLPDPYHFRPRRVRRRIVTVLVGVGVVATGYLAWAAYDDTDQTRVALAAGVGFATAVLWALLSVVTVTTVDVEDGTLSVVRGGSRWTFDLRAHESRVELFGTPGHRGWKVVLTRQGQAPVELDSSVIDGEELSRVLRHYRPREASSQ